MGLLLLPIVAAACAAPASSSPRPHRSVRTAAPVPAVTQQPTTAVGTDCVSTTRRRRVEIRSGGVRREFRLATPRRPGRFPLVVVLHGFDQTAHWIDRYTRLPAVGTHMGFVVATPQGLLDRWNFPRRATIGPDDVTFLHAVVGWLTRHSCVDRRAVFVTGFSDGADMADTAGCARPGLFRAVGAVAASVVPGRCHGPVDVLQIHGDADPIVPFLGGGGDRPPPFEGTEAVSAVAQLRAWERQDRCVGGDRMHRLRPTVELLTPRTCRSGRWSKLMIIRGGGHTWPGAARALPYGATTHAISATRQILYFFRHILDG